MRHFVRRRMYGGDYIFWERDLSPHLPNQASLQRYRPSVSSRFISFSLLVPFFVSPREMQDNQTPIVSRPIKNTLLRDFEKGV